MGIELKSTAILSLGEAKLALQEAIKIVDGLKGEQVDTGRHFAGSISVDISRHNFKYDDPVMSDLNGIGPIRLTIWIHEEGCELVRIEKELEPVSEGENEICH